MAESSISLANFFIRKGLEEGRPVTAMQVLKMVYIAHGWHLGLTNVPLIEDRIEAWKYGPVIPVLYHEVKVFGGRPCTSLLSLFDGQTGSFKHPELSNKANFDFLGQIWSKYGGQSGGALSALTHQKGTPWDKVWNDQGGSTYAGSLISDNVIRDHYSEKLSA